MGVPPVIIHWWIFHQINHPYLYTCIVGNLPHIQLPSCGSESLDQGCSACFEHRASEGVAGVWAAPSRLGMATAPKMMRGLLRTCMNMRNNSKCEMMIYDAIDKDCDVCLQKYRPELIWGTPRYFRWSSWIGSKRLRSNYQAWLRYVGSRVEV